MRYIKKSSQNAKERVCTVIRGSTKIAIEKVSLCHVDRNFLPETVVASSGLAPRAWQCPEAGAGVLSKPTVHWTKRSDTHYGLQRIKRDPVFAAAAWPARVQNFPSFLIVQMKMGPKNLETRNNVLFDRQIFGMILASQRQGSNVLQGGVSG